MTAPVEALLFDLGGVLVDIDFSRVLRHWVPVSALSEEQMVAAFRLDEPYRRHERGEIDAAQYFQSLRETLAIDADDDTIAAGWNAIFTGPVEDTETAVRVAREHLPCALFSNSNPTHQAVWMADYPDVVALFRQVFVSSEIGLRKPEPAAFLHVAAAMEVPCERILFFDDTEENVLGARDAGMQSVHVTGPEDVRRALAGLGIAV